MGSVESAGMALITLTRDAELMSKIIDFICRRVQALGGYMIFVAKRIAFKATTIWLR
jgi:hypothetical protein